MVIIGQRIYPRSRFDQMLGHRLGSARRDAGLTQEDAARELKVRVDTVSKWEVGMRRPGLKKLRKLAKLYGVSAGAFLD